MSDIKQKFIDPKTGQEIESTWQAKIAFRVLTTVIAIISMKFGVFVIGVMALSLCLFSLLVMIVLLDGARTHPIERDIHDGVARWQHGRRQRQLQRKLAEAEWAGVPKTALSLADPSTPPQPTATSLSQAENPKEEKERLVVGVDNESTELEQSTTI